MSFVDCLGVSRRRRELSAPCPKEVTIRSLSTDVNGNSVE